MEELPLMADAGCEKYKGHSYLNITIDKAAALHSTIMTHCFIIVYSDRDSWHLQASLTEGPHTVPSELRILTTKLYTT